MRSPLIWVVVFGQLLTEEQLQFVPFGESEKTKSKIGAKRSMLIILHALGGRNTYKKKEKEQKKNKIQ